MKDINAFFVNFESFAHQFAAAVKFNKAQAKKLAAKLKKEEEAKRKEGENEVMTKLVGTIRKTERRTRGDILVS